MKPGEVKITNTEGGVTLRNMGTDKRSIAVLSSDNDEIVYLDPNQEGKFDVKANTTLRIVHGDSVGREKEHTNL